MKVSAAEWFSSSERWRLAGLAAVVVGLHFIGWGGLWFFVAPRYPFMLGLAGLAYTFGLRHAFDADHIAAIDNTTRKLMSDESRPLGVGFYFSLGHSTIVLLMTIAIVTATHVVAPRVPALRAVGGLVGTAVSGLFLYVMGFVNLAVLIDLVRVCAAMRRGIGDPAVLTQRVQQGGLVTRWCGPLFRVVTKPWHMYLVGFLFGLGFDTATEVGLLTTAGVAASQALPIFAVITLPVIFAAGMALMDSADGVLMCGAYGWALSSPMRKVFYNVTITGLSVIVALFVGTIELMSIVVDKIFGLHGGVWNIFLNIDFQTMGYAVAALFMASWIVSAAVWKLGRFEERWTPDGTSV